MVSQNRRPLPENHESRQRQLRAARLRDARKRAARARADLFLERKLNKIGTETLDTLSKIPGLMDRLARIEATIPEIGHSHQPGDRKRIEQAAIQLNGLRKELDQHSQAFLMNNAALLQYTADALNSGNANDSIRQLRQDALAQRAGIIRIFRDTRSTMEKTRRRLQITE